MTTKPAMLPLLIGILGAAACAAGGTPDAKSASSTTATTGAAPAPASDDLSDLETKRLQDSITANFPKAKAQFKDLCGSDVELEIDWKSFGHNKNALETMFSNLGFQRVIESFQAPCSDKTGKDAVRAKVKKIRAVNIADKNKDNGTISGGVFTVENDWGSGSPTLYGSDLAAMITKGL